MSARRELPRGTESSEPDIGYSKPPKTSRFRRGQSGNPRGRPPGRRREPPYEGVLGQLVKVRSEGTEQEIRADQAFALKLMNRALEGNPAATRLLAKAIEEQEKIKADRRPQPPDIVVVPMDPASVTQAILMLGMAKKLDRYRDTARMALEPWLVEAALAKLEENHLSPEEQEIVVKAARTPHKVKWPKWWVTKP